MYRAVPEVFWPYRIKCMYHPINTINFDSFKFLAEERSITGIMIVNREGVGAGIVGQIDVFPSNNMKGRIFPCMHAF